MKPSRWTRSALALCIMGSLTACGGGGSDANNEGDVISTPPAASGSSSSSGGGSSSGGSSGGDSNNTSLYESFGDGTFVGFDEADTQYFFSQEYKALDTTNPEDSWPSFYYPTCCFFANDNPVDGPEVALDQMGIVSDNGNPAMLLNTGRFSVGQTRPAIDDADPKKDTTTSDDVTTWGELDLSQPYRISFCVKDASGTRNMQVYVDNNTSGEANSIWGGGSQGSRIFNVPAGDLIPGKRVQINIPGDITFEPGGDVKDQRPAQVGSAGSFLQFRVEGGSAVIFDDLLIEPQSEDGQADLPACNVFQPASPPKTPEAAPVLTVRDAALGVNWDNITSAASYDLAWNTTGEIPTEASESGLTGTAHLISELENGTTYYVFLRAANSAGTSDWSPAATGVPEAPAGCSPTTQVNTTINWSVWDGCVAPYESGAVVVDGSVPEQFSISEGNDIYYTANDDGTTTLDTTDGAGADAGVTPNADLSGVMTDSSAGYPRYFTWIGRINTPTASVRGFEVEISFGEADKRRVKTILRPDSGKVQLEKFIDNSATAEGSLELGDGYHIYHLAFTINGEADITARVYRDGVNVSDLFTPADDGVVDVEITGTGRDGGSSSPRLRMGDGSGSNPYIANIDWLIWSDDASVAALTPAELVGELPDSIGDLGDYAGEGQSEPEPVLSENFDGATDGDAGSSSLFTAEYKSITTDAGEVPFYNAIAGSSSTTVSNGAVSFYNARFTLGDPTGGNKSTTAGDQFTRGVIDLSKPYRISFDVMTNNNADDGSGKCQVYVDNDGTSSGESYHGSASKIFESPVLELSNGLPTGPVVIEDSVGTATSFIQFRCDSGVEADTPITIDNLVIEYQ